MQYRIISVALACMLASCSDGVYLESENQQSNSVNSATEVGANTVSADGAISNTAAAEAINNPVNKADEPAVIDWVGTSRQRVVECSSNLEQSAQQAFATEGFIRVEDDDGGYLQATGNADQQTPQYIEYCITVDELARYRINTVVRAPSKFEDSFFVTIDEDTPGTIAEPGIYDVLNGNEFQNHIVRVRTESPLIVSLTSGTHVVRFYLREPNTAIRGIRLESIGPVSPDPDPNDPDIDIAQCASNTGLSAAEINSAITEYLGNVERRFVLSPFEEEREYTVRNDYRWDTANGRGNIMCLAPPPAGGTNLVDNTITEGRIVFGSEGVDLHRAATPLRGTFIGNGGDDRVGVIDGGVFIAGKGNDYVELIRSGKMDAGAGDDEVGVMRDGQYDGGAGNDSLVTQFGGTFDGGVGTDSIRRQLPGALSVSVESTSMFDTLIAPTDIEFVDSTSSSTLVRWTASTDARVQGYLLNITGDSFNEINVELGAAPRSLSPLNTRNTEIVIERITETEPVIQIRAYTELDDGSFLYSDPLSDVFVAPVDGGVLPGTIIATAELFDTEALISTTLSTNGSVLVANFRAPTNSSTPVFIRLDSQLENQTPVFNDTISDSSYSSYPGDERQYITSRTRGEARTTVVAFNRDASAVLWEQEIPDTDPATTGACPIGYVTQDDWLICATFNGRIEAFDPDGVRYSQPDGFLETRNTLVDGANGILIEIQENQEASSLDYSILNVVTGQAQMLSLVPDAETGAALFSPQGLVVDNDHMVLTGGFLLECEIRSVCGDSVELSQGFYVLRALIGDGSINEYTSGPSENRAGEGVGQLVGDTVVFSRENGFSSYRAATLELINRRSVPGDVKDVSADAVLSQESILDSSRFVEGYRLYLLQP